MALSKCTSVVNDDCDDVGVVVGCEVGAGSDSKNRNRLRHARANTGHAIADGGGSGGIAPNWPRSADRPELIGHFVGIRAGARHGAQASRVVVRGFQSNEVRGSTRTGHADAVGARTVDRVHWYAAGWTNLDVGRGTGRDGATFNNRSFDRELKVSVCRARAIGRRSATI